MTRQFAVFILLLLLSSISALGQDAPQGFEWKHFPELGVTVQVPNAWHSHIASAKGTKALQITREKIEAKGFETGLTINLIEPGTDAEMSAAITSMGDYMAKLHDSFTKVVDSRITEMSGVPTWILEGTRTLPDDKARGLYHTRTTVYIFKADRRIYTIIFGAPAALWESDYKFGNVMLNPIKFDAK